MNQIMEVSSKNSLIQENSHSTKKFTLNSSTLMAKCVVCGKGLESGFSVTAKSIQNETLFFCKIHLN